MTVWRVPVELSWSGQGGPGANIWHVRCNSGLGADSSELQAGVDSIHAFYTDLATIGTLGGGLWPSGTKITLGPVVETSSETVASPTWSTIGPLGGAGPAPSVLQCCVTWNTSLAARRGRGRTFLGPLANNMIGSDGSLDDSALNEIKTACQNLASANAANNGWAVAIWGQQDKMVGPNVTSKQRAAAPHVARDIIGYTIKDKTAVLRSRRD